MPPLQSTYSATDANPYQAPDPTQVQPPAPPPDLIQPPKESPFQGQPGFNFQGAGNISHVGAAAGLVDNILRGYVNGKAQGEQHKALLLQKKSSDLNASATADAQNYLNNIHNQLQTTGTVNWQDPDLIKAKSAMDGSYGAVNEFRANLLQQQGGKKGKKQDDRSPGEILHDPKATPQEKGLALLQMQQKLGNPVEWQAKQMVAQYDTPQAKAARAAGQAGAAGAQSTAETNADLASLAKRMADLAVIPNPNAEQKAQLEDAKKRYLDLKDTLTAPKVAASQLHRYSDDGKEEYDVDAEGNEVPNTRRPRSTAGMATPKLGTLGAAMTEYASENDLDPAKMPLEAQNYVRELWAWEGRGDTSSTTTTLKQDDKNRWVPVTETNDRSRGPKPAPPRGMKAFDLGDAPPPATPEPGSYPLTITQSLIGKEIPGLVQPGNIDLRTRPNIKNADGTHSSVYSMSSEIDGKEVMYPGVGDGKTYPARQLTQAEALDQYKKTGNNLGTFKNAASADAYARWLHQDQEKFGNDGAKAAPGTPTRRTKPGKATATPDDFVAAAGGHSGRTSVGAPLMGAPDASLTTLEKDAEAKKTQYAIASRAFLHLTPAGSNDILMAYTRSQIQGAGRLNDAEIKRNLAAGTYGERMSSMYSQFTKGQLNTTMLRNMVHEMGNAAEETQKAVDEERARREEGTVAVGGKKPSSNLPQRPNGVPPNYVYFVASDGNGHWIDPKNLDAAKKIDPKLQVIQ